MIPLFVYGQAELKDNRLTVNELVYMEFSGSDVNSVLNETYRTLNLNYPKFHRMDIPSKLAFVVTELLISKIEKFRNLEGRRVSICLQSNQGCLDTDEKYRQTIVQGEGYFPSPSIFVYTLPNIPVGEICIRNGFKGENISMITEGPDKELAAVIISDWFETNSTDLCLYGWVNIQGDSFESSFSAIGANRSFAVSNFV